MRAARAAVNTESSFQEDPNSYQFKEDDVDLLMSQPRGRFSQETTQQMNNTKDYSTSRISWASDTFKDDDNERRESASNMVDELTESFRAHELANGVYGRRSSGTRILKKPTVENIFEDRKQSLTAPIIMDRLRSYLPRSILGYNSELNIALGFECDLDESYWSHYSTRHDKNRYNQLRRDIESACHEEFNGGGCFPNTGGSPPPTIVFYERPPPARLGSFEVVLSLLDAQGGIQHILLHTKLGSAHFPSVKNIVQRIHNIIGSNRAKYQVDVSKLKPELSHPFSQLGRSTLKQAKGKYTGSRDPNTSFGFSQLPGFNASRGLSTNGETPLVSETWTTFSGGRNSLKNNYKKQMCELCGESDYMKISPVADRFNNAASGKEHGFRSSYNHRLRADQHNSGGLSRFQVRMVGDCCLSRCVGCGWSYLDEANHEQACLPWDDEEMPAELMSKWGVTRFSCRHIPQQRYKAHVPLDSRQRRRVFVDIIDLKCPLETFMFGENAPLVELVSETTGEVIPLEITKAAAYQRRDSMENEEGGSNEFQYASNLLTADIVIPDIYTLRVLSPTMESENNNAYSYQSANSPSFHQRGGRYEQKNWVHPFEIGYHGPVLMTCEVEFDASISVEVRDMSGALLNNATVNLLTPSSTIFQEEETEKDLIEDMGKSNLAKQLGHVYALGKAPRNMTVEIPKIYQLKCHLWGHHQVDFMKPFKLDYNSWPKMYYQHESMRQGSDASRRFHNNDTRSPPLTLCVTMVRFDVKFLCVDAFGNPLPPQHFQPIQESNISSASSGWSKSLNGNKAVTTQVEMENSKERGWRLTMTEYCSNTSLPISSYLVQDATCEDESQRIVTIGSLKSPDTSNHRKDEHKMVDKFWSLNVESGKHFVSRIRVGRREVHAGEFKLSISDWLAGDNVYDHEFNAYRNQGGQKMGNEPLLITVEFGAFDVLVLFRNVGFSGYVENHEQSSTKTTKQKLAEAAQHEKKKSSPKTAPPSIASVVADASHAKHHVRKEGQGQLFEAPLGTSVALVAVPDSSSNHSLNSSSHKGGGSKSKSKLNINDASSFVPRRVELSTSPDDPTSFSPDMLRVLKGRYQIQVSAPGFTANAVRIGGVNVGVTNHRHVHDHHNEKANNMSSGRNKASKHVGKGFIDFNEELWQTCVGGGESLSGSSELLVEVDLEFDPIPVMTPAEIVAPCPYDLNTKYALCIDICFVIDGTGSMGCYLEAAGHAIYNAERDLKIYYPHARFRYGCIIYRDLDPQDVKKAGKRGSGDVPVPIEVKPFTSDVEAVEDWLLEVKASGGGDVPEDMFAGLSHAAHEMSWQGDVKLCLVISDAPCHGSRFHDPNMEDYFPEEPDPHGHTIESILNGFRERQVKFVFGRINRSTDLMIKEFKRVCNFQNAQEEQATLRAKQAIQKQQEINKANRSRMSRKQQREMLSSNKSAEPFGSPPNMPAVSTSQLVNGTVAGGGDNNDDAGSDVLVRKPVFVNDIQVIELPKVDVRNYEDSHVAGEELGKLMDDDEVIYEEQSNFLRDVIRESLIVNSVHKEVCSLINLNWSVPAHVIYGSLHVVEYELQYSPLIAPGGLPTADHAKTLRERHLSRSESGEGGGGFPSGASGDESRKWQSISVSRNGHTFRVPSVVPTIFRVRAICDDGYKTGFSEEQMFTPFSAEKDQIQIKNTNRSLESIDKIIVKRSDHIDAISFAFTDGTLQNFTYLGGEKQQHLDAVNQSNILQTAKSSMQLTNKSENKIINNILDLMPSEHVVEVRGINSTLHCEAIEFTTSFGRKSKFDCEAAYKNPGTTAGFQYCSHPGRRVVGLKLRFTSTVGMDDGMIDVLSSDSQGFVIDGCEFDDIPFLSPEESKAALIAASKEHARKQATLTYHVDAAKDTGKNRSNSGKTKQGDGAVLSSFQDTEASSNDAYEVDGNNELTSRERAAIDRRVAEREAFIANEKYKQLLIENAKLRQKDLEMAQERQQNRHVNVPKKTASLNMKSHSTRKKTYITVVNNTDKAIKVCWVDYRGKEIQYYTMAGDETKKVSTFVGHCWVGRDTHDEVVFTAQVSKEQGQKVFCA